MKFSINKKECDLYKYRDTIIIRKLDIRYLVYLVILYIVIVNSKIMLDVLVISFNLFIDFRIKSYK